MNVLIYGRPLCTDHQGFSEIYYLFKTHYKHYGQYPDDINWMKICPLYHESPQDIINLCDTPPDIIFLSLYVWNKAFMLDLINLCHSVWPNVPVFCGGPDIDLNDHSEMLSLSNVLGIIEGEGEVPITELIDRYHDHLPIDNIDGLWLRKNDSFIKPTNLASRIAYSNGKGSKNMLGFTYVSYSCLLENINEILTDVDKEKQSPTFTHTMFYWQTARGCPYGCVFCDWGGGIQQKVRRRNHQHLEQEIELIVKYWPGLFLSDANFGIFEEDYQITCTLDQLLNKYNKKSYLIYGSFAKNNPDRVKKILDIFNKYQASEFDHDIADNNQKYIPMQNADEGVLQAIKRVQLSPEKLAGYYDYENEPWPIKFQIILGLPGSNSSIELTSHCRYYDVEGHTQCHMLEVSPQAPMSEPAFVNDNSIEWFYSKRSFLEFGGEAGITPKYTSQIRYIKSCSSFTVDDLINQIVMHNFLKFLEEFYVLKMARQLAKLNGYTAYEFYQPIVNRFLTDRSWLNVDISRKSVTDWIMHGAMYNSVGKSHITADEVLIERVISKFNQGSLVSDLLSMVGHMHEHMEQAITIGCLALPGSTESVDYRSNLSFTDNRITINAKQKELTITRPLYIKFQGMDSLKNRSSAKRSAFYKNILVKNKVIEIVIDNACQ